MDEKLTVKCDRCRTDVPLPRRLDGGRYAGVLSCPRCFHHIALGDAPAPVSTPEPTNPS